METARYTRLYHEDCDIGLGLREVRLTDGRVMLLQQMHVGNLCPVRTVIAPSSPGAPSLEIQNLLPLNMRIMGVTTLIMSPFGSTQGLTAFAVGDPTIFDLWGQSTGLFANSVTQQEQFSAAALAWPLYTTATPLIITALGGLFDGSGRLEITVHYFALRHRRAR